MSGIEAVIIGAGMYLIFGFACLFLIYKSGS